MALNDYVQRFEANPQLASSELEKARKLSYNDILKSLVYPFLGRDWKDADVRNPCSYFLVIV